GGGGVIEECDHLGLEGLVSALGLLEQEIVPLAHALLCLFEEAAVGLVLDQRQQRREDAAAVADEANVGGVAQADARGVAVDLDAVGLTGLGEELDVGEAAAGDEQCVAALHGVLRRGRAQQADTAGGVRAVVGNDGLAQERLDDRPGHLLGQGENLVAGAQAAAGGQDGHLLALVEHVGGLLELLLGRQRRRGGEGVG